MNCECSGAEMVELAFDPEEWEGEIPAPGSKVYECPRCGALEAYEPEG